MSANGSSVLASSFGVFAGAEEDPGLSNLSSAAPGALYDFARNGAGWIAQSLAPSSSTYENGGAYDATSDTSTTLWALAPRSQEAPINNFYLEAPKGKFTEVGPITPSASGPNDLRSGGRSDFTYAGSSEDLSHVLYETGPAFRWRFDTTVGESSSLYELVGLANPSPWLVGVLGGRESTDLVSQCGTRLGSSSPDRGVGVNGSLYNAISGGGERIFFTAVGADDNPCGGKQPPVDELLAREESPSGSRRSVTISEPSASYCSSLPAPPCADANFEGASADGTKVFFTSTQKLLEGASEGSENLYEYDFNNPGEGQAQKLVLVSSGSTTPAVQGVVRISEDGSHVYFVAQGVLTSVENNRKATPTEGDENLYVFERDALTPQGHISFVGTLESSDGEEWARADNREAEVSPDGQSLVFASGTDLLHEGVSVGVKQIFQYNAQTDTLVRVSVGQHGYNNNGGAPLYNATTGPVAQYARSDSSTNTGKVLTAEDGAVFFQSPTALTPQALNNQTTVSGVLIENVYEYRDGEVYLISDGRDTSFVRLIGISASGGDVFFETADSLVAQDTSTQRSIYDARVDGGFLASATPAPCNEEVCQGALSAAPAFGAPASATLTGNGNLTPPHTTSSLEKRKLLTNAQKLIKGLKSCRTKHNKHERSVCESQAHRRYGPKSKTARKVNRRAE